MPRFSLKTLLLLPILTMCLLLAAGALMGTFRRDGGPNSRSGCSNNLRQLALALQMYHSRWGSYPPACTYDANGRPMHSWRVMILPYLEYNSVYQQYDFSQPWNSAYNARVLEHVRPDIFICSPSKGRPNDTDYLAVVGDDCMWPDGQALSKSQVTDREGDTILLVEVRDSGIHWAEPRDLPFDKAVVGINPPNTKFAISSGHADGVNVVCSDGMYRFLEATTSPEVLRALLTRNGGEQIFDHGGEFRLDAPKPPPSVDKPRAKVLRFEPAWPLPRREKGDE